MLCVLAFALIATMGATATKDVAPRGDEDESAFWLKTKLADELLASRLNVTNIPKLQAKVPTYLPVAWPLAQEAEPQPELQRKAALER